MVMRPAVRSIRGLGIALVGLLAAQVVVRLSQLVAIVMEMDLLHRDMRGARVTGAQIRASNWRLSSSANVADGIVLVTAIVWLVWQHRAQKNLEGLGATWLRFTPGWAVGWWFVPFASLVKPFQTVRELWKASGDPHGWQMRSTSPLLGWWWGLYLGAPILIVIFAGVREEAASDADLLAGDWWGIAAVTAWIAAAIFAALLVWSVVRGQAAARTAVPPRRDLATVPPRPA